MNKKTNKIEKPELNEAAGTKDGRDITRNLSGFTLTPTDPLLLSKGGKYDVYAQVLSDDQVKTAITQRISAVVAREWMVEPGADDAASQAAADWLKAQLHKIRWDAVTEKMLFGVHYGYSVAELIYEVQDAKVGLSAIKVRDRQRFVFDLDGQPRLRTKAEPQNGETLPPNKFWHFCTGADHDDEPYGLGLAHWLYWPVYFKRHGVKAWLVFLEKLGTPPVVGKYPRGATRQEKDTLLQALLALQSDGAVIMPDGMAAELLEATRSATPDFATLTEKMDAAISKVVLGQTMTSENGSSRAQAQVHFDVRADIVKADADLVCESFNRGPAKWLTAWNFPNATSPRVWRRIEDEPDQAAQAARDKTIFDMGFRPSLAYVQETYGGEWTEQAAPAPAAMASARPAPDEAAFADEPRDAVDDLADQVESLATPAMDKMIDQVRDLLNEAKSLQEFADRLIGLYPSMQDEDLARLMQSALASAHFNGRDELVP